MKTYRDVCRKTLEKIEKSSGGLSRSNGKTPNSVSENKGILKRSMFPLGRVPAIVDEYEKAAKQGYEKGYDQKYRLQLRQKFEEKIQQELSAVKRTQVEKIVKRLSDREQMAREKIVNSPLVNDMKYRLFESELRFLDGKAIDQIQTDILKERTKLDPIQMGIFLNFLPEESKESFVHATADLPPYWMDDSDLQAVNELETIGNVGFESVPVSEDFDGKAAIYGIQVDDLIDDFEDAPTIPTFEPEPITV